MPSYKLKFKNKIPIEDQHTFADKLMYYSPFFKEISPADLKLKNDELIVKSEKIKEEFQALQREYSDILTNIAKIRFRTNELYNQNRVIALTTGLLRHKLIELEDKRNDFPFDYDETLKFVENFIYRYITKKEDDELVEQVTFKE